MLKQLHICSNIQSITAMIKTQEKVKNSNIKAKTKVPSIDYILPREAGQSSTPSFQLAAGILFLIAWNALAHFSDVSSKSEVFIVSAVLCCILLAKILSTSTHFK